MKLRTKMFIAFISIIIMPVALTILFTGIFRTVKVRPIEKEYGTTLTLPEMLNLTQTINEMTGELLEKMKRDLEKDPEKILQLSYLERMDRELTGKFSFLVVFFDEKIFYARDRGGIQDLLPALSFNPTAGDGSGVYISGSMPSMVKQLSVQLTDGTSASVYLVTTLAAIMPEIQKTIREVITGILLILLITAAVMTFWIYKGISSPIEKLQEATHRIADGDLDFTLDTSGNDEFADLNRDFEMMRLRLSEAVEEKRRYDEEGRELIRNISHDLKTPITTIRGYVEGIMDGVADTPQKMDHYVKTIYKKTAEMDHLVDELTFYSRIDNDRMFYEFTKLNVRDFFDDCADEVSIEMEERQLGFVYNNNVSPGTFIQADPEQMKRVMSNIIVNSIKYMDKSPAEISLSVYEEGEIIHVEIGDNGPGIASEDLERIFDRFYRTDESRTSPTEGSGIGLSIVKKIIEDHSGRIWAESEPGKGTVMHFELPKVQEVPV